MKTSGKYHFLAVVSFPVVLEHLSCLVPLPVVSSRPPFCPGLSPPIDTRTHSIHMRVHVRESVCTQLPTLGLHMLSVSSSDGARARGAGAQ